MCYCSVPNVSSAELEKVIEYCTHHQEDFQSAAGTDKIEASPWDAAFIQVELSMVKAIVRASDYLDIKPLLWV